MSEIKINLGGINRVQRLTRGIEALAQRIENDPTVSPTDIAAELRRLLDEFETYDGPVCGERPPESES